jgi:hypothetical protein
MRHLMTKEDLGELTLIQGAIDGAYTVHEIDKGLGISTPGVKAPPP